MMNRTSKQKTAALFERIGRLLECGVPLLKALETLAVEQQYTVAGLPGTIAELMKNGETFSDSLAAMNFLPDDLVNRIRGGEERGRLDRLMKESAEQIAEGVYTVRDPVQSEEILNYMKTRYEQTRTLICSVIEKAVRSNASDLHLEPTGTGGRLRFRIDGVLKLQPDAFTLAEYKAIVSGIKEMAALDVAEHKLPQDGRILMHISTGDEKTESVLEERDLRVSVCPYVSREKIVIRFLNRAAFPDSLEQIGISSEKIAVIQSWLSVPYGMILVSGPAGSGKTTTLYLLLKVLAARSSLNIVTVEDPVEYRVDGIYQMQINPSMGLTFQAALRSLMRQDPDSICAGEIRAPETATLLVQAAQSGHLTLSQVHAHNAIATVRLMHDLGVPVHMLREILTGVISQRLVRKLCVTCKKTISETERMHLPGSLKTFSGPLYRATGCNACHGTGYRGRTVLMELLSPGNEFWQLLDQSAPENRLAETCSGTFRTLLEDGFDCVREGVTSFEEIERVLASPAVL